MRRTSIATGLLVVALAITAAVFGGLAAASTQATHAQPLGVAVHSSSGVPPTTVSGYMQALQRKIPDPTAVSPAKIKAVAKATAKQMGVYSAANFTITIKCSWPPISCTVIITL
jgi:hypothetical protein